MITNENEAMEVKNAAADSQAAGNRERRDSSSKIIFDEPILCAQFLRDYVDIPLLKNVKAEDIEDVTERYVHLFTEERNSDVVKKVYLKNEVNSENEPDDGNKRDDEMNIFYLISLIEHKSDVDYNVVMQVFRYITFIWEDYEKEQERKHAGISKTKGFRYPPVLPIVFYDGPGNWTAVTSLHERVLFSDVLGKYIPDYRCVLIQLKDYSNADLMKNKNELALLLMIDKLRNAADYENMGREVSEAFPKEATENTPEYLRKLMAEIIGMFLLKLNIPEEEIDELTEQVKERKMGELFKHFEGWDVQALRQEIKEAQEETAKAQEETAKAQEETAKAQEEAAKAQEETAKAQEETAKAKEEAAKAKEEAAKAMQQLQAIIEKYHIPETSGGNA